MFVLVSRSENVTVSTVGAVFVAALHCFHMTSQHVFVQAWIYIRLCSMIFPNTLCLELPPLQLTVQPSA